MSERKSVIPTYEELVSQVRSGERSTRSFTSMIKKHYIERAKRETLFLDQYDVSDTERIYYISKGYTDIIKCPYCGDKVGYNASHNTLYPICHKKECRSKQISDVHSGSTKCSELREEKFHIAENAIDVIDDESIKSLYKYDTMVKWTTNPRIIEYLTNRFPDSASLLESVQRIRRGVELKPVCPSCGKPVTWLGKDSHLMTKYCSDLHCPANNPETQQLKKDTQLRNWGSECCYTSDKYRSMMREKYGVEYVSQREDVKEKHDKTMIERYGTTSIYKIDGMPERIKETLMRKYGTYSINMLPEVRRKKAETAMRNSKSQSSKSEDRVYSYLVSLGYSVDRWHYDDRFPYSVDFYIRDLDLFIEYQGSQYHNYRAYMGTAEDVAEANELLRLDSVRCAESGKESSQYGSIHYVWTDLDVRKREYARDNHINYLEIYRCESEHELLVQMNMYLISIGKAPLFTVTESSHDEFDYYKSMKCDTLVSSTSNRNVIVKEYQWRSFFKKELELYANDPVIRRKVIQNRSKYLMKNEARLTPFDVILGFKRSGIYYGYSHFNPKWTNWIVNHFGIKSVYDPCGGWGHHMLGELSCDKLIYNEIDPTVCDGVSRIVSDFGIDNVTIHNGDATTYVPDDVDAFIMCPPYYNVEEYSVGGFASIEEYKKFLNDIFSIWECNSARLFAVIIRDDFVDLIDRKYSERYQLSVHNSHLSTKKNFESIYIYYK